MGRETCKLCCASPFIRRAVVNSSRQANITSKAKTEMLERTYNGTESGDGAEGDGDGGAGKRELSEMADHHHRYYLQEVEG